MIFLGTNLISSMVKQKKTLIYVFYPNNGTSHKPALRYELDWAALCDVLLT